MMKTWPDRLQTMHVKILQQLIDRQKAKIAIDQRDLATMERILASRTPTCRQRETATQPEEAE